jgi:TM2 domain-containing membrane protein YozV
MYTILGYDGIEYGPVDLKTLLTWATERRVFPNTPVKDLESGLQCNAAQLPSLQTAFNRPPMQPVVYHAPVQIYYPNQVPARGLIQTPPGTHSVAIAILLSLFCFLGFGQIYNRQAIKGVVILLSAMVLAVFTMGVSILVTYPLAAIDAGLIAARLNRGEAITEWQWF